MQQPRGRTAAVVALVVVAVAVVGGVAALALGTHRQQAHRPSQAARLDHVGVLLDGYLEQFHRTADYPASVRFPMTGNVDHHPEPAMVLTSRGRTRSYVDDRVPQDVRIAWYRRRSLGYEYCLELGGWHRVEKNTGSGILVLERAGRCPAA